MGVPEDMCVAYKYLANFYLKHNRLDEAFIAAQKCTEYNEVGQTEECISHRAYVSA